MITYEFPYNERIRTLLRLESLTLRCLHFSQSDHSMDHQTALSLLFELTDISARLELKRDVLQDLERIRQHYVRFRDNPDIEADSLEALLAQITDVYLGLQGLSGPIGHHIRNNEWLSAIRKRNALPGGICEFDLPSYHFWANLDAQACRDNLDEWLTPFLQLHEAVSLILRLTRETSFSKSCVASSGLFQERGGLSKSAQMLRIHVPKAVGYVPEVMANKHMLQIRFIQPDFYGAHLRLGQAAEDVSFDISVCSF